MAQKEYLYSFFLEFFLSFLFFMTFVIKKLKLFNFLMILRI